MSRMLECMNGVKTAPREPGPRYFGLIGTLLLCLLAFASPAGSLAAETGYAGSAACAGCHEAQHKAWRDSHHGWALREATPENVIGDFNDAAFTQKNITTRFFRKDGKYFVETDGADGQPATFGCAIPSELRRFSNIWSRPRKDACRPSISPGMPKERPGITFIRRRMFLPAVACTGPEATRTGKAAAPNATRPGLTKVTIRKPKATRAVGRSLPSHASPAMEVPRLMWSGRTTRPVQASLIHCTTP